MSPVSRALLNKRRRDSYVSKKRLFKTLQEKADRRRQVNKDYNMRAKEQRENNLHPDSIAMANPQWKPELLFPPGAKPSSRVSEEMVIPDFGGSPVVGGTRTIRNTTLTQVKVLNTFNCTVKVQRDCNPFCK
jgi:hypothetical protein